MKNAFGIIGAVVIAILIVGLLVGLSVAGRGCQTASEMANQTVFNSSKNVWSYEQFYQQYESFFQHAGMARDAEQRIKELEGKGRTETQEYNNYVMQAQGARQMMRRIAEDYNAASRTWYKGIWKGKNLPERLNPDDYSILDMPRAEK